MVWHDSRFNKLRAVVNHSRLKSDLEYYEVQEMSKLKKTAMNLLVKQLQPQHYTELYKQFQALDTNQNGLVDATDFMN